MTQLQDLSRELLDLIANEGRQFDQAYKTLANLPLASQRLRAPAQDALHCSVVVTRSKQQLGFLARTLIERRDLAYKVRKLSLSATWAEIKHEPSRCARRPHCGCGGECDPHNCGWDNVKELCGVSLKKTRFFTGLNLYDPKWMRLLRQGSQLAMCGVIVACTPQIKFLELKYYSTMDESDLVPGHLKFSKIFGKLGTARTFSICWIPSLANLESLSSNCLLPSQFLTLPNQSCLKLGLSNKQDGFHAADMQLPRLIDTSASKLRRLETSMDAESLCYHQEGFDEDDNDDLPVHAYLRRISARLCNLRHLELEIRKTNEKND
jgi:hypothetical protein